MGQHQSSYFKGRSFDRKYFFNKYTLLSLVAGLTAFIFYRYRLNLFHTFQKLKLPK